MAISSTKSRMHHHMFVQEPDFTEHFFIFYFPESEEEDSHMKPRS